MSSALDLEPLEITPEILGIQGISESTSQPWVIGHLIGELNNLDFDPPYQRGEVWKKDGKVGLIRSLILGLPIGCIHVVQKGRSRKGPKWVLDGKQRITTIKAFIENRLRIDLEIKGQKFNFSWEEINDPAHPLHDLVSRIKEASVQLCVWTPMDFEAQRDVFKAINYACSLSGEEKVYCDHYLTQMLIYSWFDRHILGNLEKHLPKRLVEDRRFTGIKLLHSVLVLSYGPNFEDRFCARELKNKRLAESADKIEAHIRTKKLDATTTYDEAAYELLGFAKIDKDIKNASAWLKNTIQYKNILSKTFDYNVFVEMLTFFITKAREQVLTSSYVEQNIELLYKFLKAWTDYKNKNPQIKEHSADVGSLKTRFEKMDEIMVECGIDVTKKNRRLTQAERTSALLDTPANDPITGAAFSDENVNVDHVIPKAASSNSTDVTGVLTKETNRRKNDLTSETVDKISSYIHEKTK